MNSGIKLGVQECGPARNSAGSREGIIMFYFKACTKCRGDLTLEKDPYGDFLKCMQCGKLIDVEIKDGSRRSPLIETERRAIGGAQAKTAVAA